jgi:hypothetical protein
MNEGFHLGYGVDTTYPKIDVDGTVHIDPYISIDPEQRTIHFLGQKYKLQEE